jgi:hypothetical protein
MSTWGTRYAVEPGQYGLMTIEVAGFCVQSDVAAIEAGCTARYSLEPLPQAAGGKSHARSMVSTNRAVANGPPSQRNRRIAQCTPPLTMCQ